MQPAGPAKQSPVASAIRKYSRGPAPVFGSRILRGRSDSIRASRGGVGAAFQTLGGEQQRLPCQAGLHLTRGSRLPSRKRLTTRGLVFGGFLTLEGAGVNQKSTILRNYPIYADESMRAISYPGFPELYLPGTSGRTASADSGILAPGPRRYWHFRKSRW